MRNSRNPLSGALAALLSSKLLRPLADAARRSRDAENTVQFHASDLQPERREGESFDAYKKRRANANRMVAMYLQGQPVWFASEGNALNSGRMHIKLGKHNRRVQIKARRIRRESQLRLVAQPQ